MRRCPVVLGTLLAAALSLPLLAGQEPVPPLTPPAATDSAAAPAAIPATGDPATGAPSGPATPSTAPATDAPGTETPASPATPASAATAVAATHPKAHEAAPLLPTKVTTGWTLTDLASAAKPIPFVDAPGYRAIYRTPEKDGKTLDFAVDILQVASETEAIAVYEQLSTLDSLASTTQTLEMTGLKKIVFRAGRQDSPAATAQAAPLEVIRVVAWFPPFVVRFESQNSPFGADEVKSVLSSLAWRE